MLLMLLEMKLAGEYAGASLAIDWGLVTSIQMLSSTISMSEEICCKMERQRLT
jgi:hypothetical protein